MAETAESGGVHAGDLLPPEVWRLVLESGILARRAAAVCRVFEDIWRTHADLVVPEEGGSEDGAESVDGSVDSWATWSYASDDGPPMPPPMGAAYQCCECGLWSPDDAPYSATLVGPGGEPLTRRWCHTAMLWLQMWMPAPPHSAAALAMRDQMRAVLAGWPGEVCPACYHEWDGTLD